MSIAKVSIGNADYYESRIGRSPEGYYTGEGDSPGTYFGQLAERLEAEGEASPGALERFLDGRHPLDGTPLNHRSTGTSSTSRIGGFDLTLSCPKDVSIAALLGPEEYRKLILDTFSDVAMETIDALELHAWTRQGSGGSIKAFTGELGGIAYIHTDSRAQDPNLHMHVIVANMQYVDGKWLTLDARPLYSMVKAHGMLFQAKLRAELARRLGVAFDDQTSDGQATVRGFPPELRELFSKRRSQVLTESQRRQDKYAGESGRELTGKAVTKVNAQAVLTTRAQKSDPVDLDVRQKAWAQEVQAAGFDLNKLYDCFGIFEPREPLNVEEIAAMAIGDLSASKPSWRHGEAMKPVLAQLPVISGDSSSEVADNLTRLTDRVLSDFSVIEGGQPYDVVGTDRDYPMRPHTTVSTILQEHQAIATVLNSERKGNGLLDRAAVSAEATEALGDGEQAAAVLNVATDGNGVSLIRAPAGSGKTRLCKTLASCYNNAGWSVVGLAPSAAAAEVLRQEAEIERSSTLTKLLVENDHEAGPMHPYRLDRSTVVILDEASLAATNDTAQLIDLAREAGSKLVLVGDDQQLQSVEAGGLFSVLCEHFDTNELTEVRRMTAQWEREASIGLRQGHTVALHQYMEHQRVHSGAADKLVQAAFERWDTARKTGRSLMVMARTNDRLDDFNQLARSHMRESGELRGSDVQIGKLAIAIGDEILTRRNARWIRTTSKRSVINGDRWEVTRIRPDGALDVTSMDGRGKATLPADYTTADDQISYAYGSTVHRAQGSTVDEAILLVDQAASRNLMYVGATRGRENNEIWLVDEDGTTRSNKETQDAADREVLYQILRRTDQEATGSEVVWARELGYEIDDDRIHQLLTQAGRLAIERKVHQIHGNLHKKGADAEAARAAVIEAQMELDEAPKAVERSGTKLGASEKRLEVEEAQGIIGRFRGRHDIAAARTSVTKVTELRHSALTELESASSKLEDAQSTYDTALEITQQTTRREQAIVGSLKQRLALDDRGRRAAAAAGTQTTVGTDNQSGNGRGLNPAYRFRTAEEHRADMDAFYEQAHGYGRDGPYRGI